MQLYESLPDHIKAEAQIVLQSTAVPCKTWGVIDLKVNQRKIGEVHSIGSKGLMRVSTNQG